MSLGSDDSARSDPANVVQQIFASAHEPSELLAATETCRRWKDLLEEFDVGRLPIGELAEVVSHVNDLLAAFEAKRKQFTHHLSEAYESKKSLSELKKATSGPEADGIRITHDEAREFLLPHVEAWSAAINSLRGEVTRIVSRSKAIKSEVSTYLKNAPDDETLKARLKQLLDTFSFGRHQLGQIELFVCTPFDELAEICTTLGHPVKKQHIW